MGHRWHGQHRPGAVPAWPARGGQRHRRAGRAATGPGPSSSPAANGIAVPGSRTTPALVDVAARRRRLRGAAQRAARRVDDPGAARGQAGALREAAVRKRPDNAGVLDVAATAATPLWEAFVFPFHAQYRRRARTARRRGDRRAPARSQPASTSCFRTRPTSGWTPRSAAARSLTSAATRSGWRSSYSAAARRAGRRRARGAHQRRGGGRRGRHRHLRRTAAPAQLRLPAQLRHLRQRARQPAGRVQLTNPFHPGPADTLTILRPKAEPAIERPTTDERSFTAALRHIHAVLRGEAAPEHTAGELALPAARVLEQLRRLAQPAGRRRGGETP